MATKIGDLYFEVSASTVGISKALAGIGSAAKDSGSIVDKAVGGAFIAAGIAATTALAGIATAVAAVGAEFNAASQRATGLFTALTGSAEEAVSLMREFAEVSLDTPIFTAKALQDVSRTLLAYGVAKNDVVDLAVAINSTATALGVGELGAHKLALALGQVKSRGFFSAEEARQLANYGVNAYQFIADAVGLTVSEVRELGKQHKLLSEDVLPIFTAKLQETYGPVAQGLINTFGVQVQGLKNTLTGVASALVQPFIGRTSGGAVVEFLAAVRAELDGVVTVAEDGTFRLGGALESLNVLTQALADGFLDIGYSIIEAFGSAAGGGGFQSFIENIAAAIPMLVQATKEFASGVADFFGDLLTAAEPLFDPIKNLVLILGEFVVNVLPAAADAVVNFVDAAAPIAATLIDITNLMLRFASPIIVDAVEALAQVFEDLAVASEFLGGPLLVIYGALGSIAFLATSSGGLGVLAVQGLALAFADLAAKIALAITALETYQALSAAVRGGAAQDDFLTRDTSNFFEQGLQSVARIGFAIGQDPTSLWGDWTELVRKDLERMNLDSKEFGIQFAESFKQSGQSVDEFNQMLEESGLTFFQQSYALAAYRDLLKEIADEAIADDIAEGIRNAGEAANLFESRVNAAGSAAYRLNGVAEEEIDIMKELKTAAKDAADALDLFLRPTAEATVDDFFRSLPKIIEDATDAMAMDGGPLRDLALGGALDDAADAANKIINDLVDNYGMSFEEIKAMLDERGLAGVIEAMGHITKETTKSVDPLIAKYGQLGATAEQLSDAVKRLNDQRQTAIKAQIDQVEAALSDAKDAAVAAREAITDFFTGGAGSNTQKLIDQLIGDVGDVGSNIEAGLLKGGEQGAAMIRLALGSIREQLGAIVGAGLEDGLSGQQIVDMLGPIGTVLGEQANEALNRISSLDWTEGFTPAAGAEIANLLSSVLDPQAIQKLLNDALGADASVSGLEKQLESLKAAAQVDVEFSSEQVQGALDDIAADTTLTVTEAVTTPEAAQAVYDIIQGVLSDPSNELKALIDNQNISDQVMDAAEEGAKQTHLIFDSTIAFNEAGLSEAAAAAAATFINEFNAQGQMIRDQYAQSQGFESYSAMQAALGAGVAGAMAPQVPYIPTVNINLEQGVTLDGVRYPGVNSTDQVKANSAGAGSTGTISRSLQEIYGTVLIPGLRGPQ